MTSKQAKQAVQLVIVIVGFGIFYGGYEYYDFSDVTVLNAENDISNREKKVADARTEMVRLRQFASNIEGVKLELKDLNLQLESALEHMPRNFELSALLRKLNVLAENSGVEILTFRPKKEDASKTDGFYKTVEVDFEIQGGFSQLLTYLDQVLRLKRIINIDELSIKTSGDTAGANGNSSVVLLTKGKLKTYRFVN